MPTDLPVARLRIDFAAREILADGQEGEEARFIRFSQEVNVADIREFFESKGMAVSVLFAGMEVGTQAISFTRRPVDAIGAIKAVRALTGLGLKDAKDRVEGWANGPVMFVRNNHDAEACVQAFIKNNVAADALLVKKGDNADLVERNVPEYLRPQSV